MRRHHEFEELTMRKFLADVSAFAGGIAELQQGNLIEAIRSYAGSGRPLLGICLGMQLLLDGSDEFGASEGLGLISGWVKKLPSQTGIKLPNVGWNAIHPPNELAWDNTLLKNIDAQQEMYFVHSFYAAPQDASACLAKTRYGNFEFCCAIKKNNVTGFQFHPEKSGEAGLQLIRNFLLKD